MVNAGFQPNFHCNPFAFCYVGSCKFIGESRMRFVTKLAVAALALSAYSTAASATVVLGTPVGLSLSPGPAAREHIVWDFDSNNDTAHFSFAGNTYAVSNPTVAAAPAGDATAFGAA